MQMQMQRKKELLGSFKNHRLDDQQPLSRVTEQASKSLSTVWCKSNHLYTYGCVHIGYTKPLAGYSRGRAILHIWGTCITPQRPTYICTMRRSASARSEDAESRIGSAARTRHGTDSLFLHSRLLPSPAVAAAAVHFA